MLVQSLAGAAGLTALVLLVHLHASAVVLVATAGLAGLALPQIGPLARVRWRPITAGTGAHQRRLVDAAFSYEGAADEASFAVGPALIGLGAVAVSPSGGLLARRRAARGLRLGLRAAPLRAARRGAAWPARSRAGC